MWRRDEAANQGGFELLYPSAVDKLQSLYEMLLNASLRAFIEESPTSAHGGARVPIPPLLPPDAGEDWFSMIKAARSGQRILNVSADAPSAKQPAAAKTDAVDTSLD